jgi:hypothetical protein
MAVACPIRYLVSQSFHTRPELERFAASFLHAVFASTAKLFKAKKNARPLNGELEPLAEESYAPQAALLHRERLVDCPVHKPPFWAVKRPARPYKNAPYATDSLWSTLQALNRPGRARTVTAHRGLRGRVDRLEHGQAGPGVQAGGRRATLLRPCAGQRGGEPQDDSQVESLSRASSQHGR